MCRTGPQPCQPVLARLEKDVFPWIGRKPIGKLAAPDVLAVLRRVDARGARDTAHRVHQHCGQVFRYAVATGRAAATRPRPCVVRSRPPGLASRQYHRTRAHGGIAARAGRLPRLTHYPCRLQLAPLVFVRPGELRHAEWSNVDMEKAEWRIPGEK